ncbi:MAG TPA: hypothetical protein VF177_08185 [Anaerolineae bacterium]
MEIRDWGLVDVPSMPAEAIERYAGDVYIQHNPTVKPRHLQNLLYCC